MFAKVIETEKYGQVLFRTDTNEDSEHMLILETQAPVDSVAATMKVEMTLTIKKRAEVEEWFDKLILSEKDTNNMIERSFSDMYEMFNEEEV